jgi:hypothetical protein
LTSVIKPIEDSNHGRDFIKHLEVWQTILTTEEELKAMLSYLPTDISPAELFTLIFDVIQDLSSINMFEDEVFDQKTNLSPEARGVFYRNNIC